jgi:hypothetical protein
LSDGVATLADLDNGARLNGRGRFIAVCVDTTEQVLLQVHGLESGSDTHFLGCRKLHALLHLAVDSSFRHGGWCVALVYEMLETAGAVDEMIR